MTLKDSNSLDDLCDKMKDDELPKPEYVQEFIMSIFKNWTEGPTGIPGQCTVHLDTPRKDFFPLDKQMCSLKIALEISLKFNLQKGLCFTWNMPYHGFHISDENQREAFYKKWPKETISEQTVRQFSEMVYDLILIQNGRPIS